MKQAKDNQPGAVGSSKQLGSVWGAVTTARKEAIAAIETLLLEARQDPFDFVEPCEPDCSLERHAYHQGQWDMAVRMSESQIEGNKK